MFRAAVYGEKAVSGLQCIVPLKWIECGVYGDLSTIYPKPYSIYLRWTICVCEPSWSMDVGGHSHWLFVAQPGHVD